MVWVDILLNLTWQIDHDVCEAHDLRITEIYAPLVREKNKKLIWSISVWGSEWGSFKLCRPWPVIGSLLMEVLTNSASLLKAAPDRSAHDHSAINSDCILLHSNYTYLIQKWMLGHA